MPIKGQGRRRATTELHWSGLPPWGCHLFGMGLKAWTLLPWMFLAFAGVSVALHRWPGGAGKASAGLCVLAALSGWAVLWRAAVREVDVAVCDLLLAAGVPDPEPWALFPQREELAKAAHWSRCLHCHGVNPCSSGWERLKGGHLRGRLELGFALLLCAPAAVHPWWW